ncbi:MAG: hypothetical protein ACO2PN_01760 [Pyrobaculum sp.]
MIAQADGERQAAILRAEGQARALVLLNEAASKLGAERHTAPVPRRA